MKLLFGVITIFSVLLIGCTKDSNSNNSNAGSTLRVLVSSTGQHQTINANIDNSNYVNFNSQTLMADGGSPLHNYTWSFDNSATVPSGLTIASLTGVITRNGTSSAGLSVGTTAIKVKVSDGTTTATGTVDLVVTNYDPGPSAIFSQLSSNFQLVDGVANKAYGASLYATGGTPPYSWSLDDSYAGSAGLTSAGLTVDASAGIVRGTILESASGKIISFKVIITDNTGATAYYSPVYTIQIK